MKEKLIALFNSVYGNVQNLFKIVGSKRAYFIALLIYLAMKDASDKKFAWLCVVAVAYIASEVVVKIIAYKKEKTKEEVKQVE